MTHLAAYLGALAALAVLDTIVLTQIMRPLFERHVPQLLASRPDLAAGAVFYIVYAGGIVWFAARPALAGGWGWAAVIGTGAALGALAFSTFELTSKAVLEGWSWRLVAIDTAWGATMTAAAALAAVSAARIVTPA
ncbi:hypothetical protein LNKW23_31020 [Paralimibaculum aggregatum]|uniref:DUF2177 domain-containing protein n=1 Tax=Paralimibaculum aggregatum TaxID=3036245 RepID=A0ABQ6LR58_9RHOB|nr:DUF2177 family protein [Limibaculum sp. NKW23]GMG83888.1 hypothetical protein LNKW23_31020 [Limibaculum sp. NKW23]